MPADVDARLDQELVEPVLRDYRSRVGNIDAQATASVAAGTRAYGGQVRMSKGGMVEEIAERLALAAWTIVLGQPRSSIEVRNGAADKHTVKVRDGYLDRAIRTDAERRLLAKPDARLYRISVDRHVYINRSFALAIECKAYAETAMLKRIMVDAQLLHDYAGLDSFCVLMLESQMGGDYSSNLVDPAGSGAAHAIMSQFDVDMRIVVLLEGERKVDRPIHKAAYYKEPTPEALRAAAYTMADLLRRHV